MQFPDILASYAYIGTNPFVTELLLEIVSEKKISVLIDSGAFTAYTLGKPIDIDKYVDYCKLLDDKGGAWNYIQLDVIGNEKETLKNLDYMYERKIQAMPVITAHMKASIAKRFVEMNEYICIAGGARMWRGAKRWQWKRALEVDNETNGKAKSHFLAFVKIPDMYFLPIYSGDCTTWLAGQQYSRIACYSSGGRMTGGTFYHRLCGKAKKDLPKILIDHLEHDKITKAVWRDKQIMCTGQMSYCSLKTATAFIAACIDAKKRGRKIFLVASSPQDFENLTVASRHGDERGYLNYFEAVKELKEIKALKKRKPKEWYKRITERM